MSVPYDVYSPEGRHAAAMAGTNTLSDSSQPHTSDEYTALIQQIQQALIASSGYDRWALERQYEDAEKGRQNAIALEKMREKASRYGIDEQTKVTLQQLTENARQFDANHGLEIQKLQLDTQRLGLDRAKTATDYLSTPDRFIQAGNYLNLSSRVLANQPGVGAPVGTPTPKTEQDFALLQAGGNPTASGGASTDNTPAGVAARAAGAGGSGSDARIKALRAVIDAAPPSPDAGLDNNDNAVLAAARAIYSTNLNPQQFQALQADPTNLAINRSAGRRLGEDPESWEARQRRNGIGQSSVRAA